METMETMESSSQSCKTFCLSFDFELIEKNKVMQNMPCIPYRVETTFYVREYVNYVE